MNRIAPPLDKRYLPLDKEVAMKYVSFLVEKRIADLPETRLMFCEQAGIHPMLLHSNPHLREIEGLFQDQSSIERLGHLSLREYLSYFHDYVQEGSRHGLSAAQPRWLGRDVSKSPLDCWTYQEIIWDTRPDWVIELGASGGRGDFIASVLELVGHGEVLGIESEHGPASAPEHPRVRCVAGPSTAPETVQRVAGLVNGRRTLVFADSSPEKGHVLAELRAYAPVVHVGGYLIVEDALGEVVGRKAHPGEGPHAAARAFLAENEAFVVDRRRGERFILTSNPDGFLLRVK